MKQYGAKSHGRGMRPVERMLQKYIRWNDDSEGQEKTRPRTFYSAIFIMVICCNGLAIHIILFHSTEIVASVELRYYSNRSPRAY